jgi:hypothetical protein
VTEAAPAVPTPEPARRPALSPEPGAWQPQPVRVQELNETGRFWHRWEATHVVLGLGVLVIVVMVILIVLIFANG